MRTTPKTDNRRGILITAAGLLLTLESVLVRLVGEGASASQIVFARATAQLVLVALWLTWRGQWHLIRTSHPSLHIARGLASLVCWAFYYVSFRRLDLATATTLTFTTQLFAVALAGPVLKERVGFRRCFLTAAGFAGVLLVTRVGSAAFDPAVLYGIAAAISGAVIILLSRTLTRTETTISMMFYIGLVTTAGSTIPLVIDPQPIDGTAFLLVALTCALGAFGMAVTIGAYRFGEMSALAPASYLRLVFALVFGLVLFSEFPAWTTLAGAAIIVAAALASRRAEGRRR